MLLIGHLKYSQQTRGMESEVPCCCETGMSEEALTSELSSAALISTKLHKVCFTFVVFSKFYSRAFRHPFLFSHDLSHGRF